jgi:hypothetical protein
MLAKALGGSNNRLEWPVGVFEFPRFAGDESGYWSSRSGKAISIVGGGLWRLNQLILLTRSPYSGGRASLEMMEDQSDLVAIQTVNSLSISQHQIRLGMDYLLPVLACYREGLKRVYATSVCCWQLENVRDCRRSKDFSF